MPGINYPFTKPTEDMNGDSAIQPDQDIDFGNSFADNDDSGSGYPSDDGMYHLTAEQYKELEAGNMRHKDYTQKTQTVAEARKQFEAEQAAWEAEKEERIQAAIAEKLGMGLQTQPPVQQDQPQGMTRDEATEFLETQKTAEHNAQIFIENHPEYNPNKGAITPERQLELNAIMDAMDSMNLDVNQAYYIAVGSRIEQENRRLQSELGELAQKKRDGWDTSSETALSKTDKPVRTFEDADAKAAQVFKEKLGM